MTTRPFFISAARAANLALALTAATFLLVSTGCSNGDRGSDPSAPETPAAATSDNEVIGTLVAMKDDRPVDGGIDLTLETAPGDSALVRVPSIFIPPPRDSIQAMHEVVDRAKIGDRLRARGVRDEDGALRAQFLELVR